MSESVNDGIAELSNTTRNDETARITKRKWRIWKVIEALEQNMTSLDRPKFDVLVEITAVILRDWADRWSGIKEFQSLLNKTRLLQEMEESIVAVHSLVQWMNCTITQKTDLHKTLKNHDPSNKRPKLQKDDEFTHPKKDGIIYDDDDDGGGGSKSLLCQLISSEKSSQDEKITVIDLCCGKGIFSMLLSFMITSSGRWEILNPLQNIQKIIMIDRAKDINWHHIKKTNEMNIGKVQIDIWSGINIHEQDEMLFQKFLQIKGCLAIVGIHLCKTLSPKCVSFYNTLGKEKAPFLCLAPCCLPRLVTTTKQTKFKETKETNSNENNKLDIPIDLFEPFSKRKERTSHNNRRKRRRDDRNGSCYLCSSFDHRAKQCPALPRDNPQECQRILQNAVETATCCWNCGIKGHTKAACPITTTIKLVKKPPPQTFISTSQILQSEKPFDTYCQLLANTIQAENTQVVQTNLINDHANETTQQQTNNWNSSRKSNYIVVSR